MNDIVEAAEATARFLSGVERDVFMTDDLQSAVLHKLLVIGEATAHIPEAFRQHYPQIPWSQIVAFRNFAIHAYFAVNRDIVWTTATMDVPLLHHQIARLLGRDLQGGGSAD